MPSRRCRADIDGDGKGARGRDAKSAGAMRALSLPRLHHGKCAHVSAGTGARSTRRRSQALSSIYGDEERARRRVCYCRVMFT